MSEERPSEALEFFILTFALLAAAILFAKSIVDGINTMLYFFSKANAESVSDEISDLITNSGGTTCNVSVQYIKPRGNFKYNIMFFDKSVIIDSEKIDDTNTYVYKTFSHSFYPIKVKIKTDKQIDFESVEISKIKNEIQVEPKGGIT
ncbi:MAG: hypothetical protein QXM68_03525 [Candidatus Aenigmatarchaeota archaeon]|nr:hypothetical protein [Candidatus Aenigmarchaeota archaeon]